MITAAAMRRDGKVFTGRRHPNIIQDMIKLGYTKPWDEQGFVTDKGDFLSRVDAAKHAIACGQIKKTQWGSMLFSEDLW
jgi:hypothetical protein